MKLNELKKVTRILNNTYGNGPSPYAKRDVLLKMENINGTIDEVSCPHIHVGLGENETIIKNSGKRWRYGKTDFENFHNNINEIEECMDSEVYFELNGKKYSLEECGIQKDNWLDDGSMYLGLKEVC